MQFATYECQRDVNHERVKLVLSLFFALTFFIFLFFGLLQATQEELKAAYRRLCMLYHPDKHRDPELKRQAETLFNLVHEAYEGRSTFIHLLPQLS